jgi:hypothetical protein
MPYGARSNISVGHISSVGIGTLLIGLVLALSSRNSDIHGSTLVSAYLANISTSLLLYTGTRCEHDLQVRLRRHCSSDGGKGQDLRARFLPLGGAEFCCIVDSALRFFVARVFRPAVPHRKQWRGRINTLL